MLEGALVVGDGKLTRLVKNFVAPSTWPAYGKAWWKWLEYVGV